MAVPSPDPMAVVVASSCLHGTVHCACSFTSMAYERQSSSVAQVLLKLARAGSTYERRSEQTPPTNNNSLYEDSFRMWSLTIIRSTSSTPVKMVKSLREVFSAIMLICNLAVDSLEYGKQDVKWRKHNSCSSRLYTW